MIICIHCGRPLDGSNSHVCKKLSDPNRQSARNLERKTERIKKLLADIQQMSQTNEISPSQYQQALASIKSTTNKMTRKNGTS